MHYIYYMYLLQTNISLPSSFSKNNNQYNFVFTTAMISRIKFLLFFNQKSPDY